jgi:NAD(P)H-nitrite reductase large subunit
MPDAMLQGAGVNVIHDEVVKINCAQKTVVTAEGKELQYDKLYLATGSSSFIPPIEGNDLNGVMTLRVSNRC